MRKVFSTRLLALGIVGSGVAGAATAQIAIDNGSFQTHANGGPGNAPRSGLQTANPLLLNVFGFGAQKVTNNIIADDFIVPSLTKLNLSGIRVFAYQTAATSPSINAMYAQVRNGAPNGGGSVVWGNLTSNILTSATMTGVYRVDLAATTPESNRQVQNALATLGSGPVLNAGTYWMEYQLAGSLASGPWAVPVTVLGSGGKSGANGLQFSGSQSVWQALVDNTFAQDVAFQLIGTWEVDPASVTLVQGTPFGGNVASLRDSDDNKYFVLLDENGPNSEFSISGTSPISTCAQLRATVESSSSRNDLTQFVDFRNTASVWEGVDSSTTTLIDSVRTITIGTNPNRFILSANELRARVRTIPQADLEAADGWSYTCDRFDWLVTPN